MARCCAVYMRRFCVSAESSALPFLTIITVCRNSARTIDSTAVSLANLPPVIEWLVIDGASTDDTVRRVEQWISRMSGPVRIVSELDQGIYDAMNKGLRLAHGDWVMFLNAGDTLASPEAFSAVLSSLDAGCDLVTARVRMHDPSDGYEKEVGDALSEAGIATGRLPPHQATFYRRSSALEVGGYDLGHGLAADSHLTLRLFRSGPAKHVHRVVAVYPTDGVSSRFDWRWRVHRDKARAIKAAAPAWVWRRYRWRWPVEALRATASHLLRSVGLLGVWRRIKGAR
ncbi:MAG: glycosyltransferase family 2 protein [Verrucomicrobiota bacterium]